MALPWGGGGGPLCSQEMARDLFHSQLGEYYGIERVGTRGAAKHLVKHEAAPRPTILLSEHCPG